MDFIMLDRLLAFLDRNKWWKTYRHGSAFVGLLKNLGLWPKLALGAAFLVGSATAYILTLPVWARILVGLGAFALFAVIGVQAPRIGHRSPPNSEADQPDKEVSLPKWRYVFAGAFCLTASLCVGWLAFHKARSPLRPDEVNRIESQLANVPDPSYRQLVAGVIGAFDPTAEIDQGPLLSTPDGRRTVDVAVRSSRGGTRTLIAVDILYLPNNHKGDIAAVDAADSKRADIKADTMLLCSNTGFESEAISKAKRKKIGLISIMRQGDKRIKAVIEEEVYLRKITIRNMKTNFDGDFQRVKQQFNLWDLRYGNGSVNAWLLIATKNLLVIKPSFQHHVSLIFHMEQPVLADVNGAEVTLRSASVDFDQDIEWRSQVVKLEAKSGIYDYTHGRVLLTQGPNSYTISGLNFDTAKPITYQPPVDDLGVGMVPGQVDFRMAEVFAPELPKGTVIARMEPLIRPEDLAIPLLPAQHVGGPMETKQGKQSPESSTHEN